jgi:hypothetical protein
MQRCACIDAKLIFGRALLEGRRLYGATKEIGDPIDQFARSRLLPLKQAYHT